MTSFGTLYIVATPIGNLEDLTYRAVKILQSVDYLAAEDTRRTKKLLTAYDIPARLISYHDHNKTRQSPKIVADLLDGKSVALVSDAGTPSISDPGYVIVNTAIREGIPVVPIPGVSSIITALCASGLPTDRFVFEGYLPRKSGRRRKFLESLKDEERTIIVYESPYRIMAALEEILELCSNRYIVVARELTKIHEEIVRGTVSEILRAWSTKTVKGEITLLIAGAQHSKKILDSKHVYETTHDLG